jgi:predicted nucleic acid-binding protein
MILVDTSVWIDHLRSGDKKLAHQLESTQVLIHPLVIGELACGNLSNRTEVLALLANLPRVVTATDEEVLFFIEQHQLMGRGVGYIDAHLLSSTFLGSPAKIWTRDKRLAEISVELDIAYQQT